MHHTKLPCILASTYVSHSENSCSEVSSENWLLNLNPSWDTLRPPSPFKISVGGSGPPLWSSGQEFLATDPEARGWIPAATRYSEK
jgi:hypothetical protein